MGSLFVVAQDIQGRSEAGLRSSYRSLAGALVGLSRSRSITSGEMALSCLVAERPDPHLK